jgi:hypothetical protein
LPAPERKDHEGPSILANASRAKLLLRLFESFVIVVLIKGIGFTASLQKGFSIVREFDLTTVLLFVAFFLLLYSGDVRSSSVRGRQRKNKIRKINENFEPLR